MTAAFAIVRAFLGKLPWQVWLAIALIATHAFAYHRGYDAARDKYKAELAAYVSDVEQAQAEARAAQIAVNQAAERRYAELAERTDHNARIAQVAAMDAANRFIERNRVRSDLAGIASGSPASPESGSASGGNGPGGNPELVGDFVVVPAADVRICTINTARLIAVQEWATTLIDKAD